MKAKIQGLAVCCFVLLIGIPEKASAAPAASALETIRQLGVLNGQALACDEKELVTHIRQLMLVHAPRTSQYGATFDQATQRGFLDQVKGPVPCPATHALEQQVEAVAKDLREQLPPIQ